MHTFNAGKLIFVSMIFLYLIQSSLLAQSDTITSAGKDSAFVPPRGLIYYATRTPGSTKSMNIGTYGNIIRQLYGGLSYAHYSPDNNESTEHEYGILGISLYSIPYFNLHILTGIQTTLGITTDESFASPDVAPKPNRTLNDAFEPGFLVGGYFYYRITGYLAVGIDGTYFAKRSISTADFHIGIMFTGEKRYLWF